MQIETGNPETRAMLRNITPKSLSSPIEAEKLIQKTRNSEHEKRNHKLIEAILFVTSDEVPL